MKMRARHTDTFSDKAHHGAPDTAAHATAHAFSSVAHPARKPHSVSEKVWPLLAKLGDERKTRIFAEIGLLDVRTPGLLLGSVKTGIFDRISDGRPGGVFVLRGDESPTPYVRARYTLPVGFAGTGLEAQALRNSKQPGWFSAHTPEVIGFSPDGIMPLGAHVSLTAPQVKAVLGSALDGGDKFTTESQLIKLADGYGWKAGRDNATALFQSMAALGQALQMPRLSAQARQEVAARAPRTGLR